MTVLISTFKNVNELEIDAINFYSLNRQIFNLTPFWKAQILI